VPNKPANSGVHARHTSLSSRVSLESTPARTTDLADELEHVERAGLGQVHPDGAVHDEQAPAPASSSHGACAGHNLVPQQQCSTRQMASKPATSSSSNAVVGQKVARSTAEPTSPHRRRHERRERARQRRTAQRANYLSLSYLILSCCWRIFVGTFSPNSLPRTPRRRHAVACAKKQRQQR